MSRSIRALAARSTSLVAICRKCGKKLGGGFGPRGKQSLAKALRSDLDLGKGKRATVRLVETGCLDICPKAAVVVIRGGAPGEVLIVAARTPVAEVAQRLELHTSHSGGTPVVP